MLTATAFASDDPNRSAQKPSSLRDTISVVQLRVPEKAREQFMKALSEFGKGRLEEALKRTNAALAIAGDFPNALTLRGYIELHAQQFDAANADFVRSAEIDPGFALAYLYHGATLNRLGKYDEALLNLNHYEDLNAKSWECQYEMAKSWMGKHDYVHMLGSVNRASAMGADAEVGSAVHFLRGRALQGLRQYSAARSELEASITPEASAAMVALAREAIGLIDRETAVASK